MNPAERCKVLTNSVHYADISAMPSDAALMTTCFSEYCSDASSEEGIYVLQESTEGSELRKEEREWVGREGVVREPEMGKAEKTVKRSNALKGGKDKVDLLQALLVQREAQKEAYFQESIRKEKECLALKEAVLKLQGDIATQECEKESLIKLHSEAETAWQERLQALEAAKSDLQQESSLLETHAERLAQALADAEGEKLELMKRKTTLEAKLAVPLPAPSSILICPTQSCSTQYELHTEVQLPCAPPSSPPVSHSSFTLWGCVFLALCLLLFKLSEDLRSHILVL